MRDSGKIIQPPQKPRGHELTRAPNARKRKIARRRGRIELVKSRVKRYRMLQETSRLWKAGVRDLLMAIGCALHNFRVRLTWSWALLV